MVMKISRNCPNCLGLYYCNLLKTKVTHQNQCCLTT